MMDDDDVSVARSQTIRLTMVACEPVEEVGPEVSVRLTRVGAAALYRSLVRLLSEDEKA